VLSVSFICMKVRDSYVLVWVWGQRKKSKVLGVCELLSLNMLQPVLSWHAFWNLWNIYFFNFQIWFHATINCGYWERLCWIEIIITETYIFTCGMLQLLSALYTSYYINHVLVTLYDSLKWIHCILLVAFMRAVSEWVIDCVSECVSSCEHLFIWIKEFLSS
jgi:hypothetical protein